jgi:hypothetical protein
MQWEYQVLRTDGHDHFLATLNRLGDEGWEAVGGSYSMIIIPPREREDTRDYVSPVPIWFAIMKRNKKRHRNET